MIRAVIFDLDGTLVQTERLKAMSYARAASELSEGRVTEQEVMEAFKGAVGLPRGKAAAILVQRLGLEQAAGNLTQAFGVSAPWQVLVQMRLQIYGRLLADQQLLRDSQWPHNMALLDEARRAGCKVGLATMSYCAEASRVLEALDLSNAFDFVATRDDVDLAKPEPEIYLLVASELGIPPRDCLVIEDSVPGITAALAAEMWCIAVTTPFTRELVRAASLLDPRWIVDDPSTLPAVVQQMMAERRQGS